MTQFQKMMNHPAIALILTRTIAVTLFRSLHSRCDTELEIADTIAGPFSEDFMCPEMQLEAADIQILPGEDLLIQTDIPTKEKNSRLIIQEKHHTENLDSSSVTVYIPDSTVF